MDSFYDVPRRAPVPTHVEKFLVTPVVPEVSMLCANVKTPANNYTSYNTWKMQQTISGNVLTSNRANIMDGPPNTFHSNHATATSQFLKKQVRFESPILQQRPSLTYEPITAKKAVMQNQNIPNNTHEKFFEDASSLNGKTFEQIYMANVPNRHLDLSLIDVPTKWKSVENAVEKNEESNIACNEVQTDKENHIPQTYQEFLKTQKRMSEVNKVNANDSVTDIFNYKRNKVLEVSKNCSKSVKYHKENAVEFNLSQNHHRFPGVLNDDRGVTSISSKPTVNVQDNSPDYNHHLNYVQKYLPKCDSVNKSSLVHEQKISGEKLQTTKDNSEPTNKDLLKIIAQQNEQLLILQKQVAMLLNREQNQAKQIELASHEVNYLGDKCITSTQNEHFKNPMTDVNITPRKRGMSKFSIDLMTSFEVAIRPQQPKQNFINHTPKIQEITETESISTSASTVDKNEKTLMDTSLYLQEPVKVRELCPSPEPSININMNDYDSSDDEVSASEIGATFYHNLMGQVNNILKKAQLQTKVDLNTQDAKQQDFATECVKDQIMSRVKEATLKHLRNIGVAMGSLDDLDDSTCVKNFSKDYSPTEISFAVKQILMKYLPDEQLAKVVQKQSAPKTPGIISARPEFSFATVQYMKKYNLIPSTNNDAKPVREIGQTHKPLPRKVDNPKILDITALKMQPKLL